MVIRDPFGEGPPLVQTRAFPPLLLFLEPLEPGEALHRVLMVLGHSDSIRVLHFKFVAQASIVIHHDSVTMTS